MNRLKHFILFFIAILSLSQAANLIRLAAAPALMIGFWRLSGASLCMFLLRIRNSRNQRTAFFEKPQDSKIWLWTALSGTFFFLHLWTFFYAAQNTSIANCMVIFASNPVFTALGSWVFLKDRFEKRHGLAFIFAFIGIAVLVFDRLSWDSVRSGDLSALTSAAFFSLYILMGKKARLQMSTDQFSWIIYAWTAILFFATGTFQNVVWTGYPPITWLAILGNIFFPTLLGHVLFTHLLKYFNINWMSCGKLLEPALSSLVALFAFGEKLKIQTFISFGFTAIAVLVLFWPMLFAKKTTEKSL